MKQQTDGLDVLAQLGQRMATRDGTMRLAEMVLRIRDREGRVRRLRANAAQRAFEAKRGQHNIVLKARQMGMTTWIAGRFFLRTALMPGTCSLLVAHNREAAECIFSAVHRMWELLPEGLREEQLRLRRSNAGEMVFAATGSEFRVASAADSNAGRGLSLRNLHCSEVGRWSGDAASTLAGLRAALSPVGELVLESTPNGAYGAFFDAWHEAFDPVEESPGNGVMVRHFLPWWIEPAYRGPRVPVEEMSAEEARLVEHYGLTGEQIGFRRGLERGYGALRLQEFGEAAETCFRASGSCCFELDAVERRLSELGDPLERRRNGALWVWLPAIPGRQYLLAVDTAGGGAEGDFAAIEVLDLATGMQCAELRERVRPAELAAISAALAAEYGDALVAVERNNHGAAVLALLERQPGVKLYRQAGQSGWLTSAASKPEMVARLGVLLREAPERFLSRRLLGECRTYVSDERGRMGASSGAHDDLVMAMAIAQAVRAEILGAA